ncbi:MAG: CapA family protein [Eubacteriales bacterium]|nr:CapA family protein [Eubacteriales bacterium]
MKRALFAILFWMALCAQAAAFADEITLTLGGDCVLGTREEWKQDTDTFDTCIAQNGPNYPFAHLLPIFEADDMTLLNLECVLQDTNTGHDNRKQHTFRGDPSYAQMLPLASIEQVNLANNHTVDYRTAGMESTKAALEAAGVCYSGNKTLYVWELNGHKIGFGGCRETTFLGSKPTVYRDIQKLKKQGCDVIIYSCHWGKEYSPTHNKTQARMAQYAVNSGADVVVGTHPHVVQGVTTLQSSDKTHTALVLYSLGNLVFGGTHELQTFDAMLAQVMLHFDEEGTYLGAGLTLLPVLTSGDAPHNNFQPILATGEDERRIRTLVQEDSDLDVREDVWVAKTE